MSGKSETEVLRMRGESVEPFRDAVAVEAPLELRLGAKPLTVIMRTPGSDEELALGFLYSEGIVARADDVVALTRPEKLAGDELGNVLSIELRAGVSTREFERPFYASSSCGVCGKSTIASLAVFAPKVHAKIRVRREVLRELPARLALAQPIFAATGGLHAAGLFLDDGRLLAAREDVGRHNALDKLIGWGMREGWLPFVDRILAVSGRASYEILQKAIAAGVSVVAAVGAPSSLAVELADEFGITLIGFLREDAMNVYAHADRIV